MHKVYLKPGKEDSLKRFHPWIFSGAIAHFDGEPEEGEVVEVYTSNHPELAVEVLGDAVVLGAQRLLLVKITHYVLQMIHRCVAPFPRLL